MVVTLAKEGGFTTVTLVEAVQPSASVTVKVYVPAPIFVKLEFVVPLLQEYEYGAVPPVTVDEIVALVDPKQETC